MYVDKLILIAGPTGVGKSFLINRLRCGAFPQFAKQLGITEPNSWTYPPARKLAKTQDLEVDRVVLHYDITWPWKRRLQSGYLEDQPLRIFRTSKEITVVTLWARPEIILRRFLTRQETGETRREAYDTKHKIKSFIYMHYRLAFPAKRGTKRWWWKSSDLVYCNRLISALQGPGTPYLAQIYGRLLLRRLTKLSRGATNRDVRQLYKNPSELLSLYDEWDKFCRKFSLKAHWIVNTMDDPPTYMLLNEHLIDTLVRFT